MHAWCRLDRNTATKAIMKNSRSLLLRLVMLALVPLTGQGAAINVDINGTRNGDGSIPAVGPTYQGPGAAGGGTLWNGVTADSRVEGGPDNDSLTFSGSNFLDSEGNPTTISFTMGPVGAGNQGATPGSDPTLLDNLLLDWVLVGYFGETTGQADFTISGISGPPTVDLYFYHRGDFPGGYTLGIASPAEFEGNGPFTAQNTILFRDIPVIGGEIIGSFYEVDLLGIMSGFTIVTPPDGPYVKSTAPTGTGVRPDAPITVQIWDYVSELDPDSVRVYLNDEPVASVSSARPAGTNVWTVTALPAEGFLPVATNTVRIIFADNTFDPIYRTNDFSFLTVDAGTSSRIVNIDIDGWRNPESPALTYVGEGAAGGGWIFNGVRADSSGGDDYLTLSATNLLDSIGNPTGISFTLLPIAGQRLSTSEDPAHKDNLFGDFAAVGFQGQDTGTSDFTLEGLGSAPTADLYFYFREDPGSSGEFAGSTYTIEGGEIFPLEPRGIFNRGNTVYMKNVPVVDGRITGVFSGYISGFDGAAMVAGALSGLTIQLPMPQPYVRGFQPKGRFVRPDAAVRIELQDYVTQADPDSLQLLVNGTAVVPTISRNDGAAITILEYQPPEGFAPESTNSIELNFADNAVPPVVHTEAFEFFVINLSKASNIVNIDINGVGHSPLPLGPTFVGSGAAGGGSVFNGIPALTRQEDGFDDDNITIGGTNLLDSLGSPTDISFELGPVAGGNSGSIGTEFSDDFQVLNHDWVLVGYFGQTSGQADFTIDGLDTTPIANLYFYFRQDPRDDGRFGSGIYILPGNPVRSNYLPFGDFGDQNTTFFRNVPVSNGRIQGSFHTSGLLAIMSGLTIEVPVAQVYVRSFGPVGVGIRPDTEVRIELGDFDPVQVDPDSIQLFINDQPVEAQIEKPAGSTITTVAYVPPGGFVQPRTVNVRLDFADNASPPHAQSQSFDFEVVHAATAARIVNLDIQGVRNPQEPGPVYAGLGPAGGGTVFNGLAADTRLPDGQNDDNITVTGMDLLNSIGDPTPLSFTISPVGGERAATGPLPGSINALLADYLWVNLGGQMGVADFTIGGLTTNATVDLYFYQRGDGPGIYDIPGAESATFAGGGGFTAQNTRYFRNVPVTAGEVRGTFWAEFPAYGLISGLTIVLPSPAQPDPLEIAWDGGNLVITWAGAGTLQSTADLGGAWQDIAGATSPYPITPSTDHTFYRLRP